MATVEEIIRWLKTADYFNRRGSLYVQLTKQLPLVVTLKLSQ